VTVATNMAGRGVDIVLGGSKEGRDKKGWQKEHNEVVKLGGLHVVGTEHHESRRIDNQLRGRAGRQGDPGSSRVFVSLQDDIMRLFGGEQVSKLMEMLRIPEDQPIEHALVTKAIRQSQVKVEGFNFDMRKRVVEYDNVMNKQREIIYKKRQNILKSGEENKENLKKETQEKIKETIDNLVSLYAFEEGSEKINVENVANNFFEILPLDTNSQNEFKKKVNTFKDSIKLREFLEKILIDAYSAREKQVGEQIAREMEKFVWLQAIDRLWVNHLDIMENLRQAVGLRGYGQQDPLVEYKKEGFAGFEKLMGMIEYEVVRRIFRVQVARRPTIIPEQVETNIDTQDQMGLKQTATAKVAQVKREGQEKPGRNDPCPCGKIDPKTGKPMKYKKCCYPKYG